MKYSPITPIGLAGALAGFLSSAMALADDKIQFNIPAQSLSESLLNYSDATGVKILFNENLAHNIQSTELRGEYSTEEALQKLLGASGLNYRFTSPKAVVVNQPEPESLLSQQPMVLASDEQRTAKLKPVTVVGDAMRDPNDPYNRDYAEPNYSITTKTNTPLFDSPFSLQVVPKEVINDQRSATLKDALENVSGVRSHSNDQEGYVYTIRGFQVLNLYRNSLLTSFAIPTVYETANLESLQVLKGPSSILFGRVDPGGTINMVTKRPLEISYHSLTQEFGSYGHFRTVWDSTAPLTADGSLSYRLTGSYQASDSFRNFQETDRFFIAPTLLWKLSDATEIKFDIQYLQNNSETDVGFPALGNRPANIPIGRSFQEANDPNDETYHVLGSYELNHHFNEKWTFHNRFHAVQAGLIKNNVVPVALEADGLLHRAINYQRLRGEAYATNFDLTGQFDLFGSQHDVLVGFDIFNDYYDYVSSNLGATEITNLQDPGHSGNLYDPEIDIDIFNPRYGSVDVRKYGQVINNPDTVSFSNAKTEQYGIYFQDHITLLKKLHILGGGRHDWATVAFGNQTSFGSASDINDNEVTDQHFSPRVGVLYQPWNWLSVYGSWSNSFGTNNGRTAAGNTLPPQLAEQWEAGFKTALFDQRLSATVAFYRLRRTNVLTSDLSTPDPFDSIPIGESRSQGVELDILGQITDNLGITGYYAYTDAEATKDNNGFQGKALGNVAKNSGRLFLTYDFKQHPILEGWRFGLGVTAVGSRAGNNQNDFILPGFARLDTFAAYSFKLGKSKVTTQINIENLTDKRYFEGNDVFFQSGTRLGNYLGSPIAATGTIRVEF